MSEDRPRAKGEPKDMKRDANRDPLSGAPGAHPVLTWERAKAAVRDAWDRLAHHGERDAGPDSDRYLG